MNIILARFSDDINTIIMKKRTSEFYSKATMIQ